MAAAGARTRVLLCIPVEVQGRRQQTMGWRWRAGHSKPFNPNHHRAAWSACPCRRATSMTESAGAQATGVHPSGPRSIHVRPAPHCPGYIAGSYAPSASARSNHYRAHAPFRLQGVTPAIAGGFDERYCPRRARRPTKSERSHRASLARHKKPPAPVIFDRGQWVVLSECLRALTGWGGAGCRTPRPRPRPSPPAPAAQSGWHCCPRSGSCPHPCSAGPRPQRRRACRRQRPC